MMENILAPNAKPITRALAKNHEYIVNLPTPIRDVVDPWKAPEHILPFLAWAWSVDLWDHKWSLAKKRQVVANSIQLHRLKGTEEGIRRHLEVFDNILLRTIHPPAKGYYTPAMDDAMRKQWLRNLPQIRFYPFLTRREVPPGRNFYKGPGGNRSYYADPAVGNPTHMLKSEGHIYYGRKATFYDRGVEVPAKINFWQEPGTNRLVEQVYIIRRGTNRSYYGRGKTFFGHAWMRDSRADDNVITVALNDDALPRFAVRPGSKVTDVRPERIYERVTAKPGTAFIGKRFWKFYRTSRGPHLVYDRITILDRSRIGPYKKVTSYWGHFRYGIKPYHAELLVEIKMKRSPLRSGRFWSGYMKSANMEKYHRAFESIRVAKSFRDTIKVDTTVHRVIRLRDAPRLGTFKLGQIRRVI